MTQPRFSVSEFSTMPLSFDEDLAAYAAGGSEGIGIAEAKLPEGRDDESLAKLRDSGLKATICLPAGLSILPLPPFPGPTTRRSESSRSAPRCDDSRPSTPRPCSALPGPWATETRRRRG